MTTKTKIIALFTFAFVCSGCSSKSSNEVEQVCTQEAMGMIYEYTIHAQSKEGDVIGVDLQFSASYEVLEIDINEMSEEDKEETLAELELSIGLDESLNVKGEFKEEELIITAYLDANYLQSHSEMEEKVTLPTVIEDLEFVGATCE